MTDQELTSLAPQGSTGLSERPKEKRPGGFGAATAVTTVAVTTRRAALRSSGAPARRRGAEPGLPGSGNVDNDGDDAPIVPLTREQAEQLFGPQVSRASRVTPFRVVAAQVALSVVAALAWGLFCRPAGAAALSALLGGAICWLPGALFAARLARPGGAGGALGWMFGEALRIGVAVAMFVAIARWYPGVQWVPLLVTCLIALKTYWIALVWR